MKSWKIKSVFVILLVYKMLDGTWNKKEPNLLSSQESYKPRFENVGTE